jgi:8-oxo-dGTP diphosphatase
MKLATLCYVMDEKNKKTLIIHRTKKENDYHAGKWSGLGGKFSPGESPEECAIREVTEESGLRIKNLKMNGVITFPKFDGFDDWYVFVFTIDKYSGKLIDSPEGNLKWITNDSVLSLNMWEGDKIFLDWVFQQKFFSAKFIYRNKEFIKHDVVFY